MDYIAYLHKAPKSDFGVSFPDFPGCVTAGKTLDEARRMAGEALTLHIRGMLEDGETLPQPSSIDDLAKDSARKGAVAFLVSADLERTVRVNITARESQIQLIDRLARQAGMTRSAYMVHAAVGRVPQKNAAGVKNNAGVLRLTDLLLKVASTDCEPPGSAIIKHQDGRRTTVPPEVVSRRLPAVRYRLRSIVCPGD